MPRVTRGELNEHPTLSSYFERHPVLQNYDTNPALTSHSELCRKTICPILVVTFYAINHKSQRLLRRMQLISNEEDKGRLQWQHVLLQCSVQAQEQRNLTAPGNILYTGVKHNLPQIFLIKAKAMHLHFLLVGSHCRMTKTTNETSFGHGI